jgi:[ribosomal protein S5]-alanine N-acetyltransferase
MKTSLSYILNNVKTERLTFRKLKAEDLESWMDFFNSPDALQFLPFKLHSKRACAEWLERQALRYKQSKSGLCALLEKNSGKMIGQCGLLIQEINGETEIEIGYHLIPAFWKKGFATEAALAARDYAFNNDLADSLISIIHIHNINSQKVAEKIGMKREKQIEWKGFPVYIYRIHRVISPE